MRKISEKQIVRDIERQASLAKTIRPPKKGWVKQIRELLHMPTRVLAARCGLERSTITRLEQSEQHRSITLNTLERLADGLNCDVKYILVPREPLDQYLMKMAIKAAQREISKVSQSMALEEQALSDAQLKLQTQDLAEELLNKFSSRIWENE